MNTASLIQTHNMLYASLGLLLVSLLWGMTFPIIHLSVAGIDPLHFVAWRFSIASLILLFLVFTQKKIPSKKIIFIALAIGALNAVGYTLQTLGLRWLASSRSAFLSESTVIFIPLLMPFFRLGKPSLLDIIATFICLGGVYIITFPDIHTLYWADGLTLIAALCFAAVVNFIQIGAKHSSSSLLFTFLQISFTALFAYTFSFFHHAPSVMTWGAWAGILFCAIFATVLALYLQNRCQPFVSPAKAALIFCLDPVFAAIFDSLINHTLISERTIIGGSIILLSIVLSNSAHFWRR